MKRAIRNGFIGFGAASILGGATIISGALAWYAADSALKKAEYRKHHNHHHPTKKCKCKHA
ncbi:hypothetical protein ACWOFR_13825 [Carnobacterium gallinarum]|uniref:hypothetical protein n=1 Tax=Carnobacterium gallinarum TaxID=2749 RepID=UPI000552093D|nr:hypothetical protein [Carnobacterium gallinarum]